MDDAEVQYWEEKRKEAEDSIKEHFALELDNIRKQISPTARIEDIPDVAFHNLSFHETIWDASTEILPHLEVQVVIDKKNQCFVTTGSAGYVEFGMNPPVGATLPIRCWIHTHPFGSAYFSSVDIRTVSIWQPIMECAYVIGGIGHYGFWEQDNPNQLEITLDNKFHKIQKWDKTEEE
tara:strand:- start:67 stop:600 length:534 start_codon:yes stop_codon:yes gene_type:complete